MCDAASRKFPASAPQAVVVPFRLGNLLTEVVGERNSFHAVGCHRAGEFQGVPTALGTHRASLARHDTAIEGCGAGYARLDTVGARQALVAPQSIHSLDGARLLRPLLGIALLHRLVHGAGLTSSRQ